MDEALKLNPRQKSKPFYQVPFIGVANNHYNPDFKVAEVFLKIFPDKNYYFVLKKGNNFNDMRSKRAVKQVMKNGHIDSEVWAYVNPFKKKAVKSDWGGFRTSYEPMQPKNHYAVIDIDKALKLPDRMGVDFNSLQMQMVACKMPKFLVIKTAPFRWHLLIDFKEVEPTKKVLIEKMCLLANLDYKLAISLLEKNTDSFDEYFATVGIDGSYLRQDYTRHKVRIPGFSNKNRLMNTQDPTPKYPIRYFTVRSSYMVDHFDLNNDDAWSNAEAMDHIWNNLKDNEETAVEKRKEAKKRDKEFAKKVVSNSNHLRKINSLEMRNLMKMLKPIVGKDRCYTFASLIFDNTSRLKKGTLKIGQERLAKLIGVSQPQISRIINKLCKLDFLVVKKSGYYNYDAAKGQKETKTYGAGLKLQELIDIKSKEMAIIKAKKEELAVHYQPGISNDQYLSDIRNLYYLNINIKDATKILYKKSLHYPKISDKVSYRAVKRAYTAWSEKAIKIEVRDKKFKAHCSAKVEIHEIVIRGINV